jgi:hypothetical protein
VLGLACKWIIGHSGVQCLRLGGFISIYLNRLLRGIIGWVVLFVTLFEVGFKSNVKIPQENTVSYVIFIIQIEHHELNILEYNFS